MKVLFAPDYRSGDPYQDLLAKALVGEGVEVVYPAGYRRGLPLYRACTGRGIDLLHLHWPEAYYYRGGAIGRMMRMVRMPVDMGLLRRRMPVVLTMHNRFPHYVRASAPVRALCRGIRHWCDAVVVHGETARRLLEEEQPELLGKVWSMPFPDNTGCYSIACERGEARRELGLSPDGEVHLIFGTVAEYKGIVEMLDAWPSKPGRSLWVVGEPSESFYGNAVRALADRRAGIRVMFGKLPPERLALWLRAADAALFGFREITSSGSLFLALASGLRVVVPDGAAHAVPEGAEGLVSFYNQRLPGDFTRAVADLAPYAGSADGRKGWLENHDPSRGARVLGEIYSRLLHERV